MAVSTSTTGPSDLEGRGEGMSAEGAFVAGREYHPELRLDFYREHIEPVYGSAPEGLVYHDAWTSKLGGVRVFDVWTDEEARDRFTEDQLLPAMAEPVRSGPPPAARERWYARLGRWWGFRPEG